MLTLLVRDRQTLYEAIAFGCRMELVLFDTSSPLTAEPRLRIDPGSSGNKVTGIKSDGGLSAHPVRYESAIRRRPNGPCAAAL